MRAPRVRFTVRSIMIAVAVVGLSLATYRVVMRSLDDWRMDCVVQMLIHDAGRHFHSGAARNLAGRPQPPNPRKAAYHVAMGRKWERAYNYPWFPVEPDSLEPD